ncbi:hypothetical protein CEXT_108361 [Caerostris extrusa]|uniref:Ribosomal protein S10 n=1 Tax=Caerostris extrusa TaxID=172846 RepID=A0AAV4REH6_CAEEX|nr:hypothetical protein CEXT_108361 [Caerostris extrusa]
MHFPFPRNPQSLVGKYEIKKQKKKKVPQFLLKYLFLSHPCSKSLADKELPRQKKKKEISVRHFYLHPFTQLPITTLEQWSTSQVTVLSLS